MTWNTMEDAPKDGTRMLLAFKYDDEIDYEVGMWVPNYGCPGWRTTGTFVKPFAWSLIPPLPLEFLECVDE